VSYSYYEGTWSSMPDFSKLTPVKSGSLLSLTLSITGRVNDNFGVRYSGYIKAPADGEYTFYLTSDDGSRFMIEGIEIVANQCEPERSGKIKLKAGYHAFVFDFFEGQITESFSLKWSSPNMTKRTVAGIVTGTIDESTALNDISDISTAKVNVTPTEFRFSCPESSNINVEIINLSGIVVEKRSLTVNNGLATLSNSNFKSGLYIVRVSDGTRSIIRQKVNISH